MTRLVLPPFIIVSPWEAYVAVFHNTWPWICIVSETLSWVDIIGSGPRKGLYHTLYPGGWGSKVSSFGLELLNGATLDDFESLDLSDSAIHLSEWRGVLTVTPSLTPGQTIELHPASNMIAWILSIGGCRRSRWYDLTRGAHHYNGHR